VHKLVVCTNLARTTNIMHPLSAGVKLKRRRALPMEKYIGIGFILLCATPLITIICVFGYKVVFSKEKIEVTPQKDNSNRLNN